MTLAEARKAQDPKAEREALTNLGHVFYLTGRFSKATENYEDSLAVSRRLGNVRGEAVAHRNLGAAGTAGGDYTKAEQHNQQALAGFTKTGDFQGAQMTLNNQGITASNQGRYSEAKENLDQAVQTGKKPTPALYTAQTNRGNLSSSGAEPREAIASHEQARYTARQLGDTVREAEALTNIGRVHADFGQSERALKAVQEAIDLLSKVGAPAYAARKLAGDIYLDTGRLDRAETYLKQAGYTSSLGRLYLLQSKFDLAKTCYEQLLGAAQKEQNTNELFTAYTGLGKVYEALKNYKEAEECYQKGLEITEEIRSALLLSERRNFYAARINGFSRCEPAKGLVTVSVRQHDPDKSIYPSETTRARQFADNLSQRAEGSYFGVPADILNKEREITDKLASLKNARNIVPQEADEQCFTEIANQIKQTESEHKAFVKSLCEKYGDYAVVKYPRPVKLEESSVGPSEYVLFLDMLDQGVAVRLIKGKKVVKALLTDWSLKDQEKDIQKFRDAFEKLELRRFSSDLAASLYDRLMADAVKPVPKGTPLTIIPDGMLALVPFEALVAGGKATWKRGKWGDYPAGLTYVGDLYPIAYYQSLTAMKLVRSLAKREKIGERMLVMADPVYDVADSRVKDAGPETRLAAKENDRYSHMKGSIEENSGGYFKFRRLKGTEELAANLVKLYGSGCDVYSGLGCTKKTLLNDVAHQFDRYNSVVFATHGFASNHIAGMMEPVLALTMVPRGTDGLLTMSEVAGLKINADVAALVACQTGVGVKLAGEGIMSMGRAFQAAGARSVIMSLWSVFEPSTIILMDEFFRQRKEGKGKLQALTAARAQVREAGYEHPFFWSAFVLVGESD
jgi:CHAT domain-containing protein/Tfp pilus assembly protein PilF